MKASCRDKKSTWSDQKFGLFQRMSSHTDIIQACKIEWHGEAGILNKEAEGYYKVLTFSKSNEDKL
jgi:hypothetical protein